MKFGNSWSFKLVKRVWSCSFKTRKTYMLDWLFYTRVLTLVVASDQFGYA